MWPAKTLSMKGKSEGFVREILLSDEAATRAFGATIAAALKPAREAVHHFVMHRPATLRMRMAEDRRFHRVGVFGFFDQSFEFARGTGKEKRFDATRHQFDR